MAEYSRLMKFSPLIGLYAFYNVFATNYPNDPLTGMKTALTAFVADPLTKIKAKTPVLTTLAIVIIGVPILTKSFKLPAAVRMVVKLATYYVIGDQVASLLNGKGRFGATGSAPAPTWGGQTSAYHQPVYVNTGYANSESYSSQRR